jgi:hypothetical protein
LDVRVKYDQVNKNFSTAVFRKATHTDNYIHFLSYHSNNIKKSVITGFFLRALRLCDPVYLDAEFDYIYNAFSNLSYPQWFITDAKNKAKRIFYSNNKRTWNPEKKDIIKLPFHSELETPLSNIDDQKYKLFFDDKNIMNP